ncbi:MAG: hypothetical protein J5829_03105 [Lachnospiraceae bacterium]|nr:hypothetical protein [Lachnospiraceae bacterium]
MGLFRKIGDFFAKYSIEAGFEEDDLFDGEDIAKIEVPDRNEIDISNPLMRERYVRNCCDQMLESTREIDAATREYRLVTDYLNDMEIIDKLPREKYGPLKHAAEEVMRLEKVNETHSEKIGRISNDRFEDMEAIAPDMPKALEEMKKNEDYKFLVRGDLQKLEGEKGAYAFQKKEMAVKQISCRNFVMITICSLSFIILMLLVLRYMYQMDVVLGCVIASFAAAVAMTLIFVEYIGARTEMRKASNFLNQIIAKQNTVKIRYVNVENLLQYQYRKYHVNSADELEYFWELYQEERDERRMLDEAGGDLRDAMDNFMNALKSIKLKYPTIWSHQAYAIVDRREMVELRHDLVARRGSLRKRIEYNDGNRNMAKDEVNELVKKYPNYASEIIGIVSGYEKDEG